MKEKLLLAAASLLGFATACNDKEELRSIAMYGTPYVDYKIKGKATDKAGNPIKGIEVRDGSSMRKTATRADGSYDLEGEGMLKKATVVFTDTDGPENGGDFAPKTVEIDFTESDRTAPGDDSWYQGAFARSGVDAQLDKKE